MHKLVCSVCLCFFIVGCSVSPPNVTPAKRMQLAKLLESLDATISQQQALLLSKDIFNKTSHLVKEFKLTSPALFHNTLVNVGLREKGLCYHWSDALYIYLLPRYSYVEFHLVGANIGEYLFEHNALVIVKKGVVVKGGVIEEGIIIDPWRNSGELYFSKVKEDKVYQWKHRADRLN
ncbi:MAG: hypothetical protein U9O24_05270 [Campylobacterota bacterium]|nr:hypothetical protein [Campylobacterota bacterium]